MTTANLALKFLLELAALAALAYWGASVNVALAVAAPLAMVVAWGWFAAPRSAHRLPPARRVPFELAVFALAAVALAAAGQGVAAVVFAVVVVVNAVLPAALGRLDA